MGKFVQYGCGMSSPPTWENFDVSPTLRLQKLPLIGGMMPGAKFPRSIRLGDIRSGLGLADGYADAVYCSHTLEHLALEDLRKALAQTLRILRPGGVFRFVLPDLRRLATKYVSTSGPRASIEFMEESYLGKHRRPTGVEGMLRAWLGNSEHLWMWDYDSLSAELAQAGFINIRRAQFGDSKVEQFRDVEDPGRWKDELGIECQKRA